MIDTTIVITAFHSPDLLERAIRSAVEQTVKCKVILANDGEWYDDFNFDIETIDTERPDAPYLSWYDAIHRATTPYVAILHDDDWYEPTFIERTRAMMTDETAYVFTEALIHGVGKEPVINLGMQATRHAPAWQQEAMLMDMSGVISPSCTLHRRDMLLRSLLPGGVPFTAPNSVISGPDMLLSLIPLLYYPNVGVIAEPLVNFTAHPKSTTIAASSNHFTHCELQANYMNAKRFYRAMALCASGVAVAKEGE